MDIDQFQDRSRATLVESASEIILLARMALGLTGESGEVAEKIKKVLRDHDGQLDQPTKDELAKELGDVLWYLARLADMSGYKLSEVAQLNLDKLSSRAARGQLGGSGDNR